MVLWTRSDHTVNIPNSSPVEHIVIAFTSPVDALRKQSVCEYYFPDNPIFVGQEGDTYTYGSDSTGKFVMQVTANGCSIIKE